MAYELYHHGVRGQKWGVRRYQNSDGSLKPAGKKRYSSEPESGLTKANGKASLKTKTSRRQRDRMTDEELGKRIRRLEKETRLKDLEEKNRNEGEKYTKEILKDIGRKVITTAAAGAILYAGKSWLSKNFDAGDLGNAIFNGGAKKK